MKKKNRIKTKICCHCKVEKTLKNFKKEHREKLSGKYIWYHPWCFDCRNKVKKQMSIFRPPKGGNDTNGIKKYERLWSATSSKTNIKKETTTKISNSSRRKTNSTSNTKRTTQPISRPKTKRHSNNSGRSNKSRSQNRSSKTIIKTLKNLKDNTENV